MSLVHFDVKVDIPIADAIERALDDDTMLQLHQLLADKCDPYVPYRTGALSQNVEVTPKSVNYTQPYAAKNYFGEDISHNPQYHPLATAKWDEAMMQDHGDEFISEVKDIIVRRLDEELNGKRG